MTKPFSKILYAFGFLAVVAGCPKKTWELAEVSACESKSGNVDAGGRWNIAICDAMTGTLFLENVVDGGSFTPPLIRIKWIVDELRKTEIDYEPHLRIVALVLSAEVQNELSQKDSGSVSAAAEGRTVQVAWSRSEIGHLMAKMRWLSDAK